MFMVVDVLVIRVVVYLNEPSSLFRRDDQDIKNSVGFFDIGLHGEVSSRMSVLYRWFVDKDLQVLYTRVFLMVSPSESVDKSFGIFMIIGGGV